MTEATQSPAIPHRRTWWPIILGIVAVVLVIILALAVLWSTLTVARERARLSTAMYNSSTLARACFTVAAGARDQFPDHLADAIATVPTKAWIDPRFGMLPPPAPPAGPIAAVKRYVDDHCDFYFAGANIRTSAVRKPFQIILLYDKAPDPKNRVITFMDGHSETLDEGSSRFREAVDETNKNGLRVPADLRGPPLTVPPPPP